MKNATGNGYWHDNAKKIDLTTEMVTLFWAALSDVSRAPSECWEWPKSKDKWGYGRVAAFVPIRHNAKLTENQVLEILRRLAAGEARSSVAKDFPVGQSMIGNIARGESWAHLANKGGYLNMTANNTPLPIDANALEAMDLTNLYVLMRGLWLIAHETRHHSAGELALRASQQVDGVIRTKVPQTPHDAAVKLLTAFDSDAGWPDFAAGDVRRSARDILGVE